MMKKNKKYGSLTIVTTIILVLGFLILYYLRPNNQKKEIPLSPEQTVNLFYDQWIENKTETINSASYKDNKYLNALAEEEIKRTIESTANSDKKLDPVLCGQNKPENFSLELINKNKSKSQIIVRTDHSGVIKEILVELVNENNVWQINKIDCSIGEKNDLSSEDQQAISEYFAKNISELSPEKEVLGGKFYITSLDFIDENNLIIEYEDGHIALSAEVNFQYLDSENIEINEFNIMN
ncbi:hypothetical protein CVU82_03055 [Candidatus Falkowbacteria bacterium HGW-Falkowbacteria-1]|jgi:hypothetical protein|uniref:Uncharacterized protein n=1 Tax=Candidatus Falkowbacteria bacterium HGW-Falkowbacteria-1 TaxID=2013768 RepID=A0A2N2EA41_9BACT|nr:MAG: hypothetical protein CVU82_03055 [Candidatus Falkowbacteria bacterium HGW-Falkowbacteria-1]